MPIELKLAPPQARLVALAIAYHLGRPGSELDPETLQPTRHGLAMAAGILQAQQGLTEVKVTLDALQVRRLNEAMLQSINELKVVAMRGQGASGGWRGSVNEEFERALSRLYPAIAREPQQAQDIAAAMMQLSRRLGGAEQAAEATDSPTPDGDQPSPARDSRRTRRPWWRFWGKGAPERS